ncbi:MAG: thiamine-phosphate kinase [Deltaproteobacteria bacterium]|nr:thiamine-phosphate kinase [Deltaproteobacteria bacterium]
MGEQSGEFALIDTFLRPFGLARDGARGKDKARQVVRGPGDDCAQVKVSKGHTLVATTDAIVEGVHFDRALHPYPASTLRWARAAGHKALAVNLSDLAAAGAKPLGFLCALGVPKTDDAERIARVLAEGMAPLARQQCPLVGGNVTKSPVWSLTITALGEAKAPLTRAGGKPGDALVLVGRVGGPALGLKLLREKSPKVMAGGGREAPIDAGAGVPEVTFEDDDGRESGDKSNETLAVDALLTPRPLAHIGQLAAKAGPARAHAAIDVSDGLLQDLTHLLRASRCDAVVELQSIPLHYALESLVEGALVDTPDALAYALTGGEDYALLLAMPAAHAEKFVQKLAKMGEIAAVIGKLMKPSPQGPRVQLTSHGAPVAPALPPGFDHLR